jgi:hypothetical protein
MYKISTESMTWKSNDSDISLNFDIICTCNDLSLCYSEFIEPETGTLFKNSDVFLIKYDSNYFNNIDNVLIEKLYQGPLFINSSLTHFYT